MYRLLRPFRSQVICLSCETNISGRSEGNDYDVSVNIITRHDIKQDVVHYHNDELGKEKFHK